MAFKPANCPDCGGSLQIPDDRDTINCMYCNTCIVVNEVLKITISSNLENLFRLAESASNGSNHAEAYTYFTKILEEDGTNSKAWFGKGVAAGWQSSLVVFKVPEMVSCFQNAIEFATDDKKCDYEKKSADSINTISVACYSLSREHMDEFISIDESWEEYLERCSGILSSFDIAVAYEPTDRTAIENIIHICKDNIEGVSFYDDIDEENKVRHLSQEYENMLTKRMNDAVAKLQKIDPNYQPPQIEKASSCFVVTATMGCETHPTVGVLRQFRDTVLLQTTRGKLLNSYYYRIGPKVAAIIQRSWVLRRLSYVCIVYPLSKIAQKIMSNKALHSDGNSATLHRRR